MMHYNPFAYVHSEKDILKLVTTLMTNTKGDGSGGDPFWEKSERLLLTALIAYLHYEAPKEEQNFSTLLEMLNTMQVSEDDEDFQNPVDLLFEDLARKKPNSFAGRQYKLYKLAAGKTAKSILISCGARLAPFDIQELRDLTMYDELELDMLGDRKTALFLIMSDTDSTFNFLISMVYTQLFNLLCDKADDKYGGKLPIHVRCLIDECANIGQIPTQLILPPAGGIHTKKLQTLKSAVLIALFDSCYTIVTLSFQIQNRKRGKPMEHRPVLYNSMLLTGKLHPHLLEVEQAAENQKQQMMTELLKANPAPDKAQNQLAWVQHMNSLKAQVEEVILMELIYS